MIKVERLNQIFLDCLFKKEDLFTEPIFVEGIKVAFGFNPNRINKHKDEVNEMIDELPNTFEKGWSFLNMCYTKDGTLWTGLHESMEQLMTLGVAIERISYCLPKEMWFIFPERMPYIIVKKEGDDSNA